jgi:hypothetical protein
MKLSKQELRILIDWVGTAFDLQITLYAGEVGNPVFNRLDGAKKINYKLSAVSNLLGRLRHELATLDEAIDEDI